MDLLLTAVGLYLWQCIVYRPVGAFVFTLSRRKGTAVAPRVGHRLLSPWPFSVGIVSEGFPFEIEPYAVHAPTALPRGSVSEVEETSIGLDESPGFQVRGASVLAAGRVFFRCSSAEHADHWVSVLTRLTEEKHGRRQRLIDEIVKDAFDVARCREALVEARRVVRPLRWCCGSYLTLALGVLPLLTLRADLAAALLTTWPFLLTAHLVSVAALVFADSRAQWSAKKRYERLVTAALYPPALFRAASEWVSEQLVPFHPAAVAASVLAPDAAVSLLRRELAEVDYPRWERHGREAPPSAEARARWLQRNREALAPLLRELGASDSKVALRERRDLAASSYCPLCLADFRLTMTDCSSCGIVTIGYELQA